MTFKIWGTEDSVRFGNSLDRDAITMLPTGGYVVTWRENQKIAFQLYDGNGAKSGDVHFVETSSLPQQFSNVLAYDADGGFVITWTETNAASQRDLRSQKFNFDGSAIGSASTLSTTSGDGAQMSANNHGGWATAYIESGALKLVQYNSTGVPGTPVVVTPTGAASPDVTWLGGTTHVVSYRSQAANSGISFNIVDGGSVGTAIGISGVTGADVVALTDPATGLPNGDFAVIVEKGAAGIEARLYNSSGTPTGSGPIAIAGSKPNSDFDCVSVTALKGGGFAVAYIAADGTDLGDVYVRVIDANGVAGTPIKVNARASVDSFGSQKDPQISEMADGRLSVSWHDPTLGNGLISTTIVDLRTSKVTVTGTTQNDLYAASEYAGDTLDGGAGVDTLTFKGTTTGGVTVNLATQSGSAGDGAGDSYKNFENIIGSNFNDTLVGGAGSNKLEGGAGDDYLDGGADADVQIGGSGTDTYIVNHAGDVVQETSAADGLDTVYTSVSYTLSAFVESLIASGSDAISLTGNGLNNTIIGNGANNALNGGGGDDVLSGGGGADFMDGGAGNDVYYIDDAGDRVTDGSGVDTVYLSVSYDLARLGSIENITGVGTASITLTGTAAANVLTGNDSANILYGGAGNDVLSGGAGNDRIHGQEGQDVLSGGSGRDIFVFDRRPNKSTNVDKILDFNVRDDSIYLENKYFKVGSKGSLTKPAPLASKMLHKGAKAHDADDRIIYDNKKGILYYDADGTGAAAAIKIATLSKNLKMTYKDFFVI